MVTKNNSIVAICKSHTEAEGALQQSGFDIASAGDVRKIY
jgi:hypothetical protein